MSAEAGLELADSLGFPATGKNPNDLQRKNLQAVWRRKNHSANAPRPRDNEGRVKDGGGGIWE
ncbi:MAG: hypothetical protein ACFB12_28460, partial [Leptolyngbyaceae cyanobacterium]